MKMAIFSDGRCGMHGGPSPGAPKGNQHAYKHGRYLPMRLHEASRHGRTIVSTIELRNAGLDVSNLMGSLVFNSTPVFQFDTSAPRKA